MRHSCRNLESARVPVGTEGFTIAELLVSLFVLVILLGATVGVFAATARTYERARTESKLFTEGLYVMEMIQRGEKGLYGIMKARSNSAVVAGTGDQVDFWVDKNADYTTSTADDVPMRISFDAGDGDATTLDDNAVAFDRDTTVADQLMSVGRNVESLAFSVTGDMVTVNLVLADTVRGETLRIALTRQILMRN